MITGPFDYEVIIKIEGRVRVTVVANNDDEAWELAQDVIDNECYDIRDMEVWDIEIDDVR